MTEWKGAVPFRSVVATIIGLAWLAGCMSPSPVLPSATGSVPPLPVACEAIDLSSPNGNPVNLTGRWRGQSGGTFYLRQAGSCLWFVGLSDDTGAPGRIGTSAWVNSYFGTLSSDRTVSGQWADLPWGRDVGVGVLDWHVEFADVGGEEATWLRVIEAGGGFGDDVLVEPEARVDLTARIRDADECWAVVADDGEVYEMAVMPPGWAVATPLSLLGPDGQVILPSDAFAVSGEFARGTGFCGPGLLLFADRIETSATP